jgi:Tol biopolymer transport system component
MTTRAKSLIIPSLLAAIVVLAVPAAAQATLAYTRGLSKPVVYSAQDNGGGQMRIGPGRSPKVSPDGQLIAFDREATPGRDELKLAAANGSGSETILENLRNSFYVTFSPDSSTIAATQGPEVGKEKLVLINVATGAVRTIASGYFGGVSFSPDSREVVYSRTASEKYPPRSDVYRIPVAGGAPVAITHDHNSLAPLWGPGETIVFVKLLGAKQRKYTPKNELYLMSPNGTGVKRLTHTKVGPLVQGLFPTQWSESGNQLLTEFEGQDTSYAVTVNPRTGAQRVVDKKGGQQGGFVGTALSANGKTILGFTGGFEPGPNHNVVTTPYAGGGLRILVKNAYEPDWGN